MNIAIHAPLKVKSMAQIILNFLRALNGIANEKGPTAFVPTDLLLVCRRNRNLHFKLIKR